MHGLRKNTAWSRGSSVRLEVDVHGVSVVTGQHNFVIARDNLEDGKGSGATMAVLESTLTGFPG
jgi:hypothetical protein